MDTTGKQPPKKAEMHVGVQGIGTSPKAFAFLARHGVTHLDTTPENTETETLIRHKEEAAEAGVSLEMIENAAAAGLRGLKS